MPKTTRTSRKTASKPKPRRTDRLIVSQRLEHDTYRLRGKLSSPTVCPDCGAVFRTGRWTWKSAPSDAPTHRCPACSRLHDRCPAGSVSMSGPSLTTLREELLGVARRIFSNQLVGTQDMLRELQREHRRR